MTSPSRARARACALVALAATCAACGGPRWPHVRAVGDPAFVAGARPVVRVDVLPIDLQVWTGEGSHREPGELYHALGLGVGGAVAAELARRGYEVVAQMDWDGQYAAPDGTMRTAMTSEDVGGTAYALSGYGEAQRRARGGLLVPFLPARLGEETASDATLYVGGWAFAGKDRGGSTAGKVAKGIVIGALVAVVVVAAVAALKGGGDGAGRVLEGAARGAGKAASAGARVAVRLLRPVVRIASRTTAAVVRSGPEVLDATVQVLDAWGRSATHLDLYAGRPDYYHARTPHRGRSAMQLEMTLVDNRTGRVLWHARQRFPARPERTDDVNRAVAELLALLPPAG